MNPFLDLGHELDFSKFNLKQVLEGRAAIVKKLGELDDKDNGITDPEAFDAYCERCEAIDAEVERRKADETEQAERRTRMQGLQRSRVVGQQAPPVRGTENRDREAQQDIVTNPEADGRKYSILRAINQLASNRPIDGLEGEISQEMERRSGEKPRGFYMPWTLGITRSGPAGAERRDFDTSAGTGLTENFTSRTMIDLLRNRMLLARLGAPVLTNMIGTFDIPKKTGGGTAYWVAEGNAPTESAQAVGQVAFAPSTVGCFTDITRKLMKQTSYDAEQLVRMDLNETIRLELDRVGLNGSGSGAEPEGILQNSSVPTVALGTNGAAPTLAMVVGLESEVAADNADIGSLAYITSARGRGKLKQTPRVASTDSLMLWNMDETMNGYQALATNQIPTNLDKGSSTDLLTALIFGNFQDVVYALWGGIDVNIDTASLSTSGGVRIVMLADADVQLRRAESFAKNVDLLY